MRRLRLVAGGLGFAILLVAGAGAYVVLRDGISARPAPSGIEARLARSLRAWAIPSASQEAKNPIPVSPRVLASGLAHFAEKLTDEERSQMEALNPKSPDEWRAIQDEDSFLRGDAPQPRGEGHGSHAP